MTPDQTKEFFKKTFTLKGRVFFPNLLVAAAREAGKREIFDGQFAFKAEDNQAVFNELAAFLGQAKQALYPTIPMEGFANPLKKFDTYRKMNGQPNPEYLRGHYWINASSGRDIPPKVVRQNMTELTPLDAAEVYSGMNAVLNISFWNNQGTGGGKRGFGANLNAVMIMPGGAKEGGSTGVNADQIFGAFKADMGTAPDPFAGHASPQNNQAAAPAWPPAGTTNTSGNGGGFV